jgi:hypothetical protein
MTDQMPPSDDTELVLRLTAVETGLRHFQEICDIRNQQVREMFVGLQERNERQDDDLKTLEATLSAKIAEVYALIWSVVKWGSSFLVVTLCTIILKALRLV